MATVHNEPPLIFSSSRLPPAQFLAGRVHEHTSHCRLGPLQVLRNIASLAQRREDAVVLGTARKEPHWIIKRYELWYSSPVELRRHANPRLGVAGAWHADRRPPSSQSKGRQDSRH